MNSIKSTKSPIVKHFVKLVASKSYREEMGYAVVFGTKIIREISKTIPIEKFLFINSPLECCETNIEITSQIAQKISGYPSFQDGIALIKIPKFQDLSQFKKIVILENIQDPGNVGTILRTANGLGFDGVHLIGDCADPFNQKSISASKGASFTMPINTGPLDALKVRFNFYAADMGGECISTASFQKPYALIFGNEGSGISKQLKKDSKIIAIELENEVESLNVASAAAIFCFASTRSET